jgi:hypothetical protein
MYIYLQISFHGPMRVVRFAKIAKVALPNAKLATPSTCSWWFYWTSAVRWSDTAAPNNIDFFPWFLAQMQAASKTARKPLLSEMDQLFSFHLTGG